MGLGRVVWWFLWVAFFFFFERIKKGRVHLEHW